MCVCERWEKSVATGSPYSGGCSLSASTTKQLDFWYGNTGITIYKVLLLY